ncbi:unnamed protein product [Ectocarpus sp. CCAP 1310/34]|nr:unnamed protein product [Ectocarpus sp. CCAP 1310/34]
MRDLYQHLKRLVCLSGRQAGGQQPVADGNGVLLQKKNGILQRWTRFFGTLLSTKSPTLNPDIIEQVVQRPATRATRRLGAVRDVEVERVTKGLQKCKEPDNDSLPAELLNIDDDDEEPIVLDHLRAIMVEDWIGGEIPREWKDATIKVLYKKGDRSNCNNFRGISLLCHVGSVPIKIITNRQAPSVKPTTSSRRNNADSDLGDRPSTCCSSVGIAEEMIAVIRQFHDRRRARMRMDDGEISAWFLITQGIWQGCVLSLLLFNIFFAAVIEVVAIRLSEDDVLLQNLVYLEEEMGTGARTPLNRVRRAGWGMLHADDAGVMSRSAEALARMMTVIMEVIGEFGLTVSEKTATVQMRAKEKQTTIPPPPPPPPLIIEAAGQRYTQTTELRYQGGLVNEHGDLTQNINYRSGAAWACVRRYGQELFHRPRAPFRLKTRLLQAEAMKAMLYGCMTWAPRPDQCRTLRTIHHRLLLRDIGYQRNKGTYRQLPYAETLKRVGCQRVENTIRQRCLLFAGALARQPDGRLPKRVMPGELVGRQGPGRAKPEENWQMCLKDVLKMLEAEHGSTDAEPCFNRSNENGLGGVVAYRGAPGS